MNLQLCNKARLLELHCSTGLTDWDMEKELKLATTTDQFCQDDKVNDQYLVQWHYSRITRRNDEGNWHEQKSDSFVQPTLWLLVNPNLACPIQYTENTTGQTVCEQKDTRTFPPEPGDKLTTDPLPGGVCAASSHDVMSRAAVASTESKIRRDYASSVDFPVCQPVNSRRRVRTMKARDGNLLKPGGWSRPPVNYCILIAMALSSSPNRSLNVQQIYNFTREHFPFFQTAPDGWKNTIRHNLCFSNSFRKTPHQLCRDGKRRSCLWHLTNDGRRRLSDEIHTLSSECFKELKKSMSHPELIRSLFAV
ncbi:forkhead box protein N5-like [Thalassophryne amazonica]|uniref:forkhead box protein N5-like n=1 Tax=Thalassophryne amazonica TaxID=390379 RepID=UPI0014721536|nr:forkhead box protein N5-like [Thalassophryne amazonica]